MLAEREAIEFHKWISSTYTYPKPDEVSLKLMFKAWKARGNLAKDIEDSYFEIIEKLKAWCNL